MPVLSRFLGIVVYMLYDDHSPPHFHAAYGDYQVSVEIATGVVTGRFPRRALGALMEWYLLHQDELAANWDLAGRHEPLAGIAPLE